MVILSLLIIANCEYSLNDPWNPNFINTVQIPDSVLKMAIFLTLNNRIPQDEQNYVSFTEILKLILDRSAITLVETRSSWNGLTNPIEDNLSSIIFSQFAYMTGREFLSIEKNENSIKKSRHSVIGFQDNTRFIYSDTVEYLYKNQINIDFLYLNSYSYDSHNVENIQKHHLKEIKAAYNKLHRNSIIVLDDCEIFDGRKCKLASDFLLKLGWEKSLNKKQQVFLFGESIL